MDGEPDYYAALGVDPGADAATIETAYRRRLLRARVAGGPGQEALEEAYLVLRDPTARALYDRTTAPPRDRARPGRALALAAFWALCFLAGVGAGWLASG